MHQCICEVDMVWTDIGHWHSLMDKKVHVSDDRLVGVIRFCHLAIGTFSFILLCHQVQSIQQTLSSPVMVTMAFLASAGSTSVSTLAPVSAAMDLTVDPPLPITWVIPTLEHLIVAVRPSAERLVCAIVAVVVVVVVVVGC